MILVEPVFLLLREHAGVDEASVVETERKCLKLIVFFARSALTDVGGRHRQHKVLSADAVFSGAINARLVREDITQANRVNVIVCANIRRPLVTAHKMPDPVSGAVPVGDALLPHKLMCEHVQLVAARALGETCTGKCDMTFEHKGEVTAHSVRDVL